MSLRPTGIALEKAGTQGLFVAIDDPDTVGVLLVPCSFEHRRVLSREDLEADYELYPARCSEAERDQLRQQVRKELDGRWSDCVCQPGNPCLNHWGQVRNGSASPSEVPYPENYRLAGLPRRFLRLREQIARRLAPWAFDGPSWVFDESMREHVGKARNN